MKNENQKSVWLKVIIVIVTILLIIGTVICIKHITSHNSGKVDDVNKEDENKNNYLISTHKLIDYRISECLEVSGGVICLATDYANENEELLIKINNDNEIVWKKPVFTDKTLNEMAKEGAISCNKNGFCVFASSYLNAASAYEQGLMTLFNNQGDKIWETTFDEHYIFSIEDVQIVEDGAIVVGSYRDKNEDYKGFAFKYDLNGKLLWKTIYNQDDENGFYSVATSDDGSIYVAGYINSSDSSGRGLLVKINNFGQIVWNRIYKDAQVSSNYHDILINANGKIIVLGEKDKSAQNITQQTMLLSYNSDGKEIDEHIYLKEKIDKIYLSKQNKIIGYGVREENKYANEEKQIMILNINDDFNIAKKKFLDISKYEFIVDTIETDNDWVIMTLSKESDDKTAIIRIKNDEMFK